MRIGKGDLDEPPHEGLVQYPLLQKDKKSICRTKCTKLFFKVPDCWEIVDFRASSEYRELDLPRCHLYPVPDDTRQKNEWRKFTEYLCNRDKVAIVNLECCNFYLLASHESQNSTQITALYETRRAPLALEMSGENFNEQRNSSEDNIQNSSKNGRMGQTDESSISAVKDGILGRSFVRTDPSYLITLSQTHAGWAFGAIAELIDNSTDACSPRLGISIEHLYSKRAGEKIPVLSVVDDGVGMSHDDIVRMLSFGHKHPDEEDPKRIGRFGIGFKTGAMKLGRDVLVLTQMTGSRSVAFLSQSYNEHKENLEIPIITYRKLGVFMEVDLNIQSEASANMTLNAIKEFSPFNEYLLGERLGLFGEPGTGTQIYIWNLDKWGSDYSLEWVDGGKTVEGASHPSCGDILIRSRRLRSRPGQISREVPLDYSLRAYLEVIFLDPRMKILVQGSLVKSWPLAKSLNKTSVVNDTLMGKTIQLTLGRSQVEWERMNGGIFLYWHGRLIEAYKRVGGMIHNADIGRGVLGVIDVSELMDDGKGHVWVLNNKQGFQDCEAYAKLEGWLGSKLDEYWDKHFDRVDLEMLSYVKRSFSRVEISIIRLDKSNQKCKPDHEWVQCDKCRKWRILSTGFDSDSLPSEWFCYMPPFGGKCEAPEQQMSRGVITVGEKRSRDNMQLREKEEPSPKKAKIVSPISKGRLKHSDSKSSPTFKQTRESDSGEISIETEVDNSPPKLTWSKKGPRGPPRSSKQA